MGRYQALRQQAAIIRHVFPGVEPDGLGDEDFYLRYHEALWVLEKIRR